MKTNDFQSKARSAVASISTMSPAEALAKSLTCDAPKIDSGIKSYMSLVVARSLSTPKRNQSNLSSSTSTSTSASSFSPSTVVESLQNSIATITQQNSTNSSERPTCTKCSFKPEHSQKAALSSARSLLKAINSYIVPSIEEEMVDCEKYNHTAKTQEGNESKTNSTEEEKLEFEVVRILWNGLVKSGQKPSKVLGRKSLSKVFPLLRKEIFPFNLNGETNLPMGVDSNEFSAFIGEFEYLLQCSENVDSVPKSQNKDDNDNDDDSCLVWDTDGGQAELERRRKRRALNATAKKKGNESSPTGTDSLTIEEIE
jgi:hypothetical protein